MASDRPAHDDGETRRILARLAQEADTPAGVRPRGLATKDDWPERWGRRIGMVLGPVLLALAALWFALHLSAQQLPA